MKQTIKDLFAYYYSLRRVIKCVTVTGQGQQMRMMISQLRASQVWEIKDDRGKPDDKAAHDLMEMERKWVANRLFSIANTAIDILGLKQQATNWSEKRTFTTHEEKINWAEKVFLRIETLGLYDKMVLSRLEKEGIFLGLKRKSEDHEENEQMKEVKKVLEEFSLNAEDNH